VFATEVDYADCRTDCTQKIGRVNVLKWRQAWLIKSDALTATAIAAAAADTRSRASVVISTSRICHNANRS